MDYDGERRKSRRLFYIYFIDDTACSATPEWSDGMLPIPHSLLSFTNQTNLKKDRNTATFPNKCLENRKIRINTHTHTHTGARASRYYKTFNYQRISGNNSVQLSQRPDNHSSKIHRSSVFSGTRRNRTFVRRHSSSGFPVSECRCLFPCGLPAKAPAFLEPKMKSCHEDYSRK